jgi:hypothetical protein
MVNGRMSACLREANVKARRATMMLAAAGLAISPVASNAASSLSIARAAPLMSGASFLQADDDHRGPGTAVILGVVLVVLIGAAAIAGNGNGPNNPHSP